jgi:hypothetical protein
VGGRPDCLTYGIVVMVTDEVTEVIDFSENDLIAIVVDTYAFHVLLLCIASLDTVDNHG